MPLKNYGVLKGRPVDRRLASGANAHYQVKLVDNDSEWRIAINVQSGDGSDVEYAVISHFSHPLTDYLDGLDSGFTALPASGKSGLDYIRGNLIAPDQFIPLPMNLPGPDNDLNEKLEHYIQRALADENAFLYAFGETWGPESNRDKIFGFQPGRGIHDIHMNQGNSGKWLKDNGIWQDGGLIIRFPGQTTQWVAIFLKFQTQPWHTDDLHGNPIEGVTEVDDTGAVRIIAALVNDTASPEEETVTLLNISDKTIDLAGWQLLDKHKNRLTLEGSIADGETRMFTVRPDIQLSNSGGIITLLNPQGMKVHGVSYTREQASNPGWTIPFQ